MRKIGIDARLYFQTGVGVYLRNLIDELALIAPSDIIFYLFVMADDYDSIAIKNPNFIKRKTTDKWHTFHEQLNLASVLFGERLDLMHFTYFSYPVIYKKNFISTIHDLTNLQLKTGQASTKNRLWYEIKYLVYKQVINTQVKNAKALITPTETIKNQLSSIFGDTVSKKTHTIYEGIDTQLMNVKKDETIKSKLPEKYFLYVGNFYPHKNVPLLIEAFSKTNNDYHLVLRGRKDFFTDQIKTLIKKNKLEKRIILWEHYSLAEMAYLYSHAYAVIQPSLSEGFGLPNLEAAYFNTPVLCSDIPVFKEILGDNAIYFDPHNKEALTQAIDNLVKKRPSFDNSGLIKKFSFKKMARQTLELYLNSI